MTAIQGFIKPNRRPGELGVDSVDHFHFTVPDLAAPKASMASSASTSATRAGC
jgi:hypothetical protein